MSKYNKKLTKTLFHIAKLQKELEILKERISEEFEDVCGWDVIAILEGCTEKDNCLYDSKGQKLAKDGLVDGKYYCNQKAGYCEDDFYGNMYYKIRDGVFVQVFYEC